MLDEPTNHLDVDARQALVLALNDYEGAVILISHDRHLIEACADRLWLVDGGTVSPYDGDIDSYTRLILSRARQARKSAPSQSDSRPSENDSRSSQKESSGRAARRINLQSLRKRLDTLARDMAQLEEKISVLDAALADSTLYSQDPKKAHDFARLRAKLADDLDATETDWLEISEQLELATQPAQ